MFHKFAIVDVTRFINQTYLVTLIVFDIKTLNSLLLQQHVQKVWRTNNRNDRANITDI